MKISDLAAAELEGLRADIKPQDSHEVGQVERKKSEAR
jgi:hypothetical protein